MGALEQMSPLVAKNIQDIINSAEGATPTALEKINEQLDMMKKQLDMKAESI